MEGLEKDEKAKEENQIEGEAMEGLEQAEEAMETVPEILDFDSLVQNPGLQHIAEVVFSFLEAKDLAKCRLVSRKWRDTIDPQRYWWILHLKPIKTTRMKFQEYRNEAAEEALFLDKFPKWNEVFDYFETQVNLETLKRFVGAMQKFHKSGTVFGCPLTLAIHRSDLDLIQLYMESPLEFNDPIWRENPPLHYASLLGKYEVVKLLFDKEGVDLNLKADLYFTEDTATAFQIACESGHDKIVEFFLDHALEKEIDLNARGTRGHTAMHNACMCRWDEYPAAKGNRQKQVFQVLFDHPVAQNLMNINAVDNQGVTPFHMACDTELFEVVEFFLDNALERNINIHTINIFGTTPMDSASSPEKEDLRISLLLQSQLGY